MLSTNSELAAAVRARLIDALGQHLPADEARIVVHANRDCVELHGCVRSWDQHQALEQAALSTPGVCHVDNQLALLIDAHVTKPVMPESLRSRSSTPWVFGRR